MEKFFNQLAHSLSHGRSAGTTPPESSKQRAINDLNTAIKECNVDAVKNILSSPDGLTLEEHQLSIELLLSLTLCVLENPNQAEIIALLVGAGASANTQVLDGFTLLHAGALVKSSSLIHTVIGKGANVDARCNLSDCRDFTPLHFACSQQEILSENVQLLLNAKANPDIPATIIVQQETSEKTPQRVELSGWTPALLAAQKGNWNLVKILVENGANLSTFCKQVDGSETSVFHIAVREGNEEMIDYLARKGVNVDIKGQTKETPLLLACRTSKWNCALKLVSHKADLNAILQDPQHHKYAPLHFAILANNASVFNAFLDSGADMYAAVETKESFGKYTRATAWEIICQNKNIALLKNMIAHGYELKSEGSHFTGGTAFSSWKSEIAAFCSKAPTKYRVKITKLFGSDMAAKDTGIKAKDKDRRGSSDPYLKIFAEDIQGGGNRVELWKSKKFDVTLSADFVPTGSPVEVQLNSNQKLLFVVWDYDTLTNDDFMGAASISIAPLAVLQMDTFSVVLPLDDMNPLTGQKEEEISGELEVRLTLLK